MKHSRLAPRSLERQPAQAGRRAARLGPGPAPGSVASRRQPCTAGGGAGPAEAALPAAGAEVERHGPRGAGRPGGRAGPGAPWRAGARARPWRAGSASLRGWRHCLGIYSPGIQIHSPGIDRPGRRAPGRHGPRIDSPGRDSPGIDSPGIPDRTPGMDPHPGIRWTAS